MKQPDKPKPLDLLTCLKCGHKWYPKSERLPVVCPACKRYSWNDPPQDKKAKATTNL